jgi:guanylate kinase
MISPFPSQSLLHRRGLMFILSSPSGAGKTTVSRRLLAHDPAIRLSVSATTRPMRPGEAEGHDYQFVGQTAFDHMTENGEFLEWAKVFGHSYGTPKAQIKEGLKAGQDFLFDIDWQGTQQLYQRAETDVVRVFLLPPSIDELRRRLNAAEISHWDGYDYVVVNDDINECFATVVQILAAERLSRARQTGLIGFVRELMKPE